MTLFPFAIKAAIGFAAGFTFGYSIGLSNKRLTPDRRLRAY